MQNNNKTVVGSYDRREEALDVVQRLKNDGYQKQDIILYGNQSVSNSIGDHEGVNVTAGTGANTDARNDTQVDDESLWDKIKGAFSTDTYDENERSQTADYDQDNDVLYPYRDDIRDGKIVVAVDNFRGEDVTQYNSVRDVESDIPSSDTIPNPDTNRKTDTDLTDDLLDDTTEPMSKTRIYEDEDKGI